tara:strand:- start:158 stop:301 length:144 start_codon:yes stop_codon:yes gene_type:complete
MSEDKDILECCMESIHFIYVDGIEYDHMVCGCGQRYNFIKDNGDEEE